MTDSSNVRGTLDLVVWNASFVYTKMKRMPSRTTNCVHPTPLSSCMSLRHRRQRQVERQCAQLVYFNCLACLPRRAHHRWCPRRVRHRHGQRRKETVIAHQAGCRTRRMRGTTATDVSAARQRVTAITTTANLFTRWLSPSSPSLSFSSRLYLHCPSPLPPSFNSSRPLPLQRQSPPSTVLTSVTIPAATKHTTSWAS